MFRSVAETRLVVAPPEALAIEVALPPTRRPSATTGHRDRGLTRVRFLARFFSRDSCYAMDVSATRRTFVSQYSSGTPLTGLWARDASALG